MRGEELMEGLYRPFGKGSELRDDLHDHLHRVGGDPCAALADGHGSLR